MDEPPLFFFCAPEELPIPRGCFCLYLRNAAKVRAVFPVDYDASPAGYIADDGERRDRFAALGEFDHEVRGVADPDFQNGRVEFPFFRAFRLMSAYPAMVVLLFGRLLFGFLFLEGCAGIVLCEPGSYFLPGFRCMGVRILILSRMSLRVRDY